MKMKRLLAAALFLSLLLSCIPPAQTNAATTEGYYTYSVSNGEATITDCSTSISGDITIPSTLGGYPVTSIDDYAFSNLGLRSVVIPDSVTSIGNFAFYICTHLTAVTIPDSVTSLGDFAFYGCSSMISVEIPNSVMSIGYDAFGSCDSLTGIWVNESNPNYSSDMQGVLFNKDKTELVRAPGAFAGEYVIPDSVSNVGDRAFCSCDSLISVVIGDGVTSIGDRVFFYCTSLTSVVIGDSVTTISDHAFYHCSGLTSVEIPDSVTTIGNEAFSYCESLTSVVIPDSVTTIGYYAFYRCGLTEVIYCGTEEQWNDISIGDYNDSLLNAERQYHAYQEATCTIPKTCSICGATDGESAGHSYESVVTAPTCTEQGYTTHTCSVCGDAYADAYVAAKGHSWSAWLQTAAPTCTAEGSQLHFCNCGAQETEPVAKLPHSYESVVTAPTCTAQGYTTHTCGVCGDSYVDSYVDVTEHVYEDGVCTGCGHTKCAAHAWEDGACTACGQQLIEAIDLDSDGKITAFDAQILAEAKAGLRQLTDAQWQALGDLQLADIKNYILGKFHP